MAILFKKIPVLSVCLILFFSAALSDAKTKNASVVSLTPVTDGGKYLTLYQSKTLRQLGFNFGATFDYAYEPYERVVNGVRVSGVVDDLFMGNFFGAVGITDWLSAGANMPLALWESYANPNAASPTTKNYYGKPGDLRLEMKFRILDIERHHVGLSVVPYMYFPTGDSLKMLGNGMWSPGGTVIVDGDIANRVFLTLNAGYRLLNYVRFDTDNRNAVIDDYVTLGAGINVRINDDFAALGEMWAWSVARSFFKNGLQNPTQFLVGGRYTPQKNLLKGLGFTAMGGRGITTGIGCPDWRVLLGVNFRHVYTPPPPPPVSVEAEIEEKIIITQKIHFEFNRAVIRPISYPILDEVVSLLERNPQILLIRVEGHTDWIGSDTANQRLSEKRARAVRDYLVKKGLAASRLEAAGYGESRPIADNNSVQGRARNRRTEFTVVKW